MTRKILRLSLVILILFTCSKEDSENSNNENPIEPNNEVFENGGTIEQLKLVTIESDSLTQEEYQVNLGTFNISAKKISDNELLFLTPQDIGPGQQILDIPSLNRKISYQVIENTLIGAPEENLEPVWSNLNSILDTMVNPENYTLFENFIEEFNLAFDSLEEQDKVMAAKFYKANELLYQGAFEGSISDRSSWYECRTPFSVAQQVELTVSAGMLIAAAALLVENGFNGPALGAALTAAGLSAMAFYLAHDHIDQVLSECYFTIFIQIGEYFSSANRNSSNTGLEFDSGVSSEFLLTHHTRGINNSDSNNSNSEIQDFFNAVDEINDMTNSLNSVINSINLWIPSANISSVPLASIPATSSTHTNTANDFIFNNLSFSITNNDLSLNSVTFNNGNLILNISILDGSDSCEIASSLNYTYLDEFNNVSGLFPIIVSSDDCDDTTPPVITLNGDTTINLTVGDTYNELGAIATDDVDGDISENIVIGGDTVNTSNVDVFSIAYNVSDSAGNAADEVIRIVNVEEEEDTTPPVITLNGDATIILNVGDTYNELGATATDDVDGDISDSIVIGGDSVDTNLVGTYDVNYNVSDAAGNVADEVIRTINVEEAPDTTPPVITLNGDATINLTVGDTYNELGATATDDVDGDISANIVIDGNVDTSEAFTYYLYYDVSDSSNNPADTVVRTVIVEEAIDTTPPVITLNGEALVTLFLGYIYYEQGATAVDDINGNVSANIVIGGDTVDTETPGTYFVTYNVSDAAGNSADEVVRIINIPAGSTCNSTTFTDPRDGQTYQLVQIGSQCWFAENLNYIPSILPSWCNGDNDNNCAIYGRLYRFPGQLAVEAICPSGWHVPSDMEWDILSASLGGDDVAGGAMKSTTGWNTPNTGASNSSGFSGLPGGRRWSDGGSQPLGISGYFWSATKMDLNTVSNAFARALWYADDDLSRISQGTINGFSCRCVKNE